jgi:predicted nucleic acid-binding protein
LIPALDALEVEDDENHASARALGEKLRRPLSGSGTSDYVLDEAVTLLRMRRGAEPCLGFADKVLRSKSVSVV